jgi:hypothetical protein
MFRAMLSNAEPIDAAIRGFDFELALQLLQSMQPEFAGAGDKAWSVNKPRRMAQSIANGCHLSRTQRCPDRLFARRSGIPFSNPSGTF